MQHVFGYTVGHDVKARNWMKKNMGQVVLSACMDTFCPLGPAIVTTDDLSGKQYSSIHHSYCHHTRSRVYQKVLEITQM